MDVNTMKDLQDMLSEVANHLEAYDELAERVGSIEGHLGLLLHGNGSDAPEESSYASHAADHIAGHHAGNVTCSMVTSEVLSPVPMVGSPSAKHCAEERPRK